MREVSETPLSHQTCGFFLLEVVDRGQCSYIGVTIYSL